VRALRFDPRREAVAVARAAALAAAEQRSQGWKEQNSPASDVGAGSPAANCVRTLDGAGGVSSHHVVAVGSGGVPGPAAPGQWRYAGRDMTAAKAGWCEQPQRFVNDDGRWYVRRCGAARASRCAPCAELKRGDVAAIGRSGVMSARPCDLAWLLTVTAPGADVLPWDRSLCSHSEGVDCAGDLGCVVEAQALALWHGGLGLRWSHLVQDLRRVLGPGVRVEYFKVWEPQRRGALHAHAMVRAEGVGARRFRAAVRLCVRRPARQFGRQFDLQAIDVSDPRAAARSAGYCAKYATKAADALGSVRAVKADGSPSKGFRAWSATRGYGDTMKVVQMRRESWWAAGLRASSHGVGGAQPPPCAGGALDLKSDRYASVRAVALIPSVEGAVTV